MILCAGESLIDMLPEPLARQGLGYRPVAGGAVFNSAIALGRLGAKVSYLWPLSRDQFGQDILLPALRQAGVDTALCPRCDRPTTLAFVELKDGHASYRFHDEGSAGRMFAASDLPHLPDDCQALMIGGISLVPDPCGATIMTLAQHARARAIPVMLDPNIRSFFITEPSAYRDRLMQLIALSDLVKLSAEDLAWLWPQETAKQSMQHMLTLGPQAALLTDGAQGAWAYWQDQIIHQPAPQVQVADTIGAGDTFNAGVLAALAKLDRLGAGFAELDAACLSQALDLGVRASAITVSRHGANPPWLHEVQDAFPPDLRA